MAASLPDYYFRVRDNGAFVFRVDSENRQRRLELDHIAVVKLRSGQIRPHGDRSLSPEDLRAIQDWIDQRQATLAARDIDDIHRAIDHLNLTTHWAQSGASDAQLEEITDQILLAMHDLRSVLVRKKADRLIKNGDDSKDDNAS
ncbi:hypothetical protein [Phaeobacter sp. C3_T13_0]|uniref:hypothetical protein n=1 Tax=Phaeobacter cretensis TaxID=3342641 RepID=UPI0039BD3F2F